jgi:hypothetical protein
MCSRYTDPSGLFVVEGATSTTNPLGLLVAPALIIYDLIFPQPADAPNFPDTQCPQSQNRKRCELATDIPKIPSKDPNTQICAYRCKGYGALATFAWPASQPCPPSFDGNFPGP